jgi:hypothetical protein
MLTFAALDSGDVRAWSDQWAGFSLTFKGKHDISDPTALPFDSELTPFRAAQRLAACASILVAVVARKRDTEAYCVSV